MFLTLWALIRMVSNLDTLDFDKNGECVWTLWSLIKMVSVWTLWTLIRMVSVWALRTLNVLDPLY